MYKDLNILVSSFPIPPPPVRHETEEMVGVDGIIDVGTTYDARTMTAKCKMTAVDVYDYELLRNELFRVMDSKEAFYIVRDIEPGKRWLVKYNGNYPLTQKAERGKFDIEFISFSPYSESVGTTLNLFTTDSELWQFGMGLLGDDDSQTYTHTTTNFRIYNAGDIEVNPRRHDLVITFKGPSTKLKIKNNTTGDEWSYSETTVSGDTIKLYNIKSLKNELSIFSKTNRKLITLAPGWNDFVISGTTGAFTISFDFRYRYL